MWLAPVAPHASDCTRARVASLALRDDSGFLSVAARIDGTPVRLMLDTGSDAGLITPRALQALGLRVETGERVRLEGAAGGRTAVAVTRLAEVKLGDLLLRDVPMPVGVLPAAPQLTPPVVGFLGGNVLSRFDLDIDVPHSRLSLWRIRLGSLACAPPPVWHGAYGTVPLQAHGDRLSLTVTLDGHELGALLDTGARSRIVSDAAARRLGVDAATLATEPGGITSGVDGRERVYHWHRFTGFAVDGAIERSPVLTVAPLSSPFDMLLGTDWLAHREVWISYATRKLFFR